MSPRKDAHIVKIYRKSVVRIYLNRFFFNAPQNGSNSCNNFFYRKRFDDIIICAEFETGDFIGFGGFCREHNYRRFFGQSLRAATFGKVPFRSFRATSNRENQRRRIFFVQRKPQTFLARFGNHRAKTFALKIIMQTFGNVRIVFDN